MITDDSGTGAQQIQEVEKIDGVSDMERLTKLRTFLSELQSIPDPKWNCF